MNGFELFGQEHIVWLLIGATGIAVACAAGARVRVDKTDVCERTAGYNVWAGVLAIIVLASHLLESGWRIADGSYGVDTLPLHICSISAYLTVIHYLAGRHFSGHADEELCAGQTSGSITGRASAQTISRVTGELIFCPGIAGALCALIFPDWTMYAPFSVISAASFISHTAIMMYAIFAIRVRQIRPSIRRIHIPVIFLAVYAALMIPFDRAFDVNYGFLNGPSPGSFLTAIAGRFGTGAAYYMIYALIVLAGIFMSYGICYMIRRRNHLDPQAGS